MKEEGSPQLPALLIRLSEVYAINICICVQGYADSEELRPAYAQTVAGCQPKWGRNTYNHDSQKTFKS